MHQADLVIAIGARFDDRVTGNIEKFCPHAKIIHVDIDPASISKNVKVDVNSGAIAKVNASYSLDVSASSGAIVQYKGNPEVNSNVKKSSGAIIKKID